MIAAWLTSGAAHSACCQDHSGGGFFLRKSTRPHRAYILLTGTRTIRVVAFQSERLRSWTRGTVRLYYVMSTCRLDRVCDQAVQPPRVAGAQSRLSQVESAEFRLARFTRALRYALLSARGAR